MTDERTKRIMEIIMKKLKGVTIMPIVNMAGNAVRIDGISIYKASGNTGTNIPWSAVMAPGEEITNEEIANRILTVYFEKVGIPPFLIQANWESDKEYVFPKLVNTKQNKAILNQYVHRDFLDLSEMYYLKVNIDARYSAMTDIRHEMLAWWGIDQKTLERQAAENLKKKQLHLCSIEAILNKLMGDIPIAMSDINDDPFSLKIVVGTDTFYNAAVLANRDLLQEVLGSDIRSCYILPSSVHELTICKMEGISADDLKKIVFEVNRYVLSKKDYLSDNVYKYDSGTVSIL